MELNARSLMSSQQVCEAALVAFQQPIGAHNFFRSQVAQMPPSNHNRHRQQQQQQQQQLQNNSASSTMQAAPTIATSVAAVGLPLQPMTLQCVTSQQPPSGCLRHQQQQQQQQPPIYSQVFHPQQTSAIHQTYHQQIQLQQQQPIAFQPALLAANVDQHHHLYSRQSQPQQQLEQRTNLSLNLQLHQQQFQQQPLAFQGAQKSAYPFSLGSSHFGPQGEKSAGAVCTSILSSQFVGGQLDSSPTATATTTATCSSVGTNTDAVGWFARSEPNLSRQQQQAIMATTTSQHLVEPNRKSSSSAKDGEEKNNQSSRNCRSVREEQSKFKSHLMRLILRSNIPFAYAIILVAFLITVIAATSIITILTIVLTITGYTAYPSTESTFNTSLAIGVVCASFALALVTAALVVWRRHCQAAYYYLDDPQSQASRGTNSPQLSETYDGTEYGSVPVNDWTKHVQKLHVDSDIGFSREFEQIQQSSSANLTCEHSQMPENKHKNRYINIVAYDHTRVSLRTLPGQKKPGADYINANFIDGYNKPRAYIGTQGPLVSTFDDYWRMIWEQRVVIIVMITNLQERGRRKCDMYWPKEGTETYGYVQVKLLQEVVMATYTLRTFTVKNLKMKKRSAGSERTVYQYHYTNWPDHGVPDHPLPVLSFVRKSASANPAGAGAIICHCSAGCGRSGTYIVIDAMLKQIRHRQSINVVDFLRHIRSQRNYLVQTEEQYIFIHDALVVAIDSGETEIASNCIAKYIQLLQTGGGGTATLSQKDSTYSITNGLQSPQQHLLQQQQALSVSADSGNQLIGSQSNLLPLAQASGGKTGGASNTLKGSTGSSVGNTNRSQSGGAGAGQWSLLERQYRLLTKFDANDFAVVSALKPCNRNKNRTINIIPIEGHRVHITPKAGADGSDYINASFLMGFNHLREFIVTQHPVFETFSDFWQMVYDHNSQTIVLLTQMADQLKEFPQFWPQKEDEVDYGSFKVKLTQESTLTRSQNGGLIVTRDFIMRSNQDDYELQTRVIHCPGWPECCGPLGGVFDLIQVVQNATQQQASQQKMHDGLTNTTTVTIGQEHEPQNGGPIIVVDKFGGTEAATFAVLTTLFKQINFEDAVDVYMYAKLAHQQRPGIWRSQDDYLFLYRAIESYASSMAASEAANSNQSKLLNSAPAAAGIANFHQQTMTLDRHKHKSQSAAKGLSTSTMRRETSNQRDNNNNREQQPIVELSKSSNQIVQLDQNHNKTNVAGNQHQLIGLQRPPVQPPQQQQLLIQRQQLNSVGQQQLKSMQGNSSPYNSAISIGTSPHQHLLASNGRGANASLMGAPAKPAQSQQLVGDHYLYPMN